MIGRALDLVVLALEGANAPGVGVLSVADGNLFDHAPDQSEVGSLPYFAAVEFGGTVPADGGLAPVFDLYVGADDARDVLTVTDTVVGALIGEYLIDVNERLNTADGWIVTMEVQPL